MRLGTILAGLAILAAAARAEAQVDQKRIDDAIAKGVTYLRTSEPSGWDQHINNCDELVLLTLIHADVPEKDPKVWLNPADGDQARQDDLFLNAVRSAGMVRTPMLRERLSRIANSDANLKARDMAMKILEES